MNPSNNHRNRNSFVSFAALIALACTVGPRPAIAADAGFETHSVKVSFADLNLNASAGAAALYRRIQRAARQVCSQNDGGHGLGRYADWKLCYDGAVSGAVEKVNSPLLTALHSGKASDARVAENAQGTSRK